MPWNKKTDREKYAVIRQRYASDLWDEEFALVRPLLPARKSSGRRPTAPRAILNAPSYLIRAGCPWRYLPKDFSPFTTLQNRSPRVAPTTGGVPPGRGSGGGVLTHL